MEEVPIRIRICQEILGDNILGIIEGENFPTVNRILDPIDRKSVNVVDPDTKYSYKLPLIDYVVLTNKTLQEMDNKYYGDSSLNFLESILAMCHMNNSCTGKILLSSIYNKDRERTYYQTQFFLEGDPVKIIPQDEKLDQKMLILAADCLARINRPSCVFGNFTFTTIALGNSILIREKDKQDIKGGHANILLILKNNVTNRINIIKYEPHGYKIFEEVISHINNHNNKFIKDLVKYMEQVDREQQYTFNIMSPIKINHSRGIQIYINDSRGMCQLISTFWMFIVLKLLIRQRDSPNLEDTFNNLNVIEECLFTNLRSGELTTSIINFSIEVLNRYLEQINGTDMSTEFNRILIKELKKFYEEQNLKLTRFIKPKKSSRKRHIPEEESDAYLEEKKANDCEPCTTNNDCKSYNCINQVCTPYGETPKLPENSDCNTNEDCCSNSCSKKYETDTRKKCVKNVPQRQDHKLAKSTRPYDVPLFRRKNKPRNP